MLRPNTITVTTIALCGVTLALGSSFAVQPRFVQPVGAMGPVFQGWGMALAARAIGMQCNALAADQIADIDAVIADARAKHVAAGPARRRFFEDVYADLKRQYDGKYAESANCTADAKASARSLAQRAHKYLFQPVAAPAKNGGVIPHKFMRAPPSTF